MNRSQKVWLKITIDQKEFLTIQAEKKEMRPTEMIRSILFHDMEITEYSIDPKWDNLAIIPGTQTFMHPKSGKRTKTVTISMTDNQKTQLKDSAVNKGMKISEYVRMKIFSPIKKVIRGTSNREFDARDITAKIKIAIRRKSNKPVKQGSFGAKVACISELREVFALKKKKIEEKFQTVVLI